ncbi:hypothetical protein [Nocardiopsis composta]|uniref:Uncharacterized protein n=1 Tax=Nocardiopsis composta TaxID=157465 RepID=A0A7W8QQT1_9ACTN|nr:hypothetical protein [Nocardiopsis composta]MBB5434716.1 hypothetical protein [Nocardiopsis composta]
MSPTHPGPGPSRPFAVFGLLAVVSAMVIAAVLIAPAVHPVVRANEAHIAGEELMVRLLSFDHREHTGEPATVWGTELVNGTDRELVLTVSTGCRVGLPPRRAEALSVPEEITLPVDEARTWSDGCVGLAAGERFLYTVRLLDGAGNAAYPPVTFIGESPRPR